MPVVKESGAAGSASPRDTASGQEVAGPEAKARRTYLPLLNASTDLTQACADLCVVKGSGAAGSTCSGSAATAGQTEEGEKQGAVPADVRLSHVTYLDAAS